MSHDTTLETTRHVHIDGSVRDRGNSIANALESPQSRPKPLTCTYKHAQVLKQNIYIYITL